MWNGIDWLRTAWIVVPLVLLCYALVKLSLENRVDVPEASCAYDDDYDKEVPDEA